MRDFFSVVHFPDNSDYCLNFYPHHPYVCGITDFFDTPLGAVLKNLRFLKSPPLGSVKKVSNPADILVVGGSKLEKQINFSRIPQTYWGGGSKSRQYVEIVSRFSEFRTLLGRSKTINVDISFCSTREDLSSRVANCAFTVFRKSFVTSNLFSFMVDFPKCV